MRGEQEVADLGRLREQVCPRDGRDLRVCRCRGERPRERDGHSPRRGAHERDEPRPDLRLPQVERRHVRAVREQYLDGPYRRARAQQHEVLPAQVRPPRVARDRFDRVRGALLNRPARRPRVRLLAQRRAREPLTLVRDRERRRGLRGAADRRARERPPRVRRHRLREGQHRPTARELEVLRRLREARARDLEARVGGPQAELHVLHDVLHVPEAPVRLCVRKRGRRDARACVCVRVCVCAEGLRCAAAPVYTRCAASGSTGFTDAPKIALHALQADTEEKKRQIFSARRASRAPARTASTSAQRSPW